MKNFLTTLIIAYSGFALLIFLAVKVFMLFLDPISSNVEVARIISPDQNLVAFVIETNGGATTSFGYVVKIQGRHQAPDLSKNVASLYGAVRSSCAYGVDLEWQSNDVLLIKYLEAKNVKFTSDTIIIRDKNINVKLISGITNSSAPCGGMEYSLKR